MTQTTSVRHFPLYIGGERVDTEERAYGMSVRAVLAPGGQDTANLYRLLREGTEEELHAHPHVLCSVALSTPEHGAAALRAAAAAVPRLRAMSVDERLSYVRDLHERFLAHHEELATIMHLEGCPRVLASAVFNGVLDVLRQDNLDLARSLLRQEISTPRHRIVLRRQPDGVVCVDPSANAPLFAVMAMMVMLAGNAVVIRVPRSCVGSLSYVLHTVVIPALEARGAPPGMLNVVCADYEVTMRQWLDSPLVDSVYYFGSSENGLALERECVARGKKPILELSGNDGVLVWHDADLDHATAALVECFYGSGQVCISPKYVIAHPAIAGELLDRLVTAAGALRPGDPADTDTVLSPVLRATAFQRTLTGAVAAGATRMCGGARTNVDGEPDQNGMFVEPTVLRVDGFAAAERISAVRGEAFFPMLFVVVPADGPHLLDECLAFLDGNPYGLRNSLWATDTGVIDRFTTEVANGALLKVNDSHTAQVPGLPIVGGTGQSGGTHGEAAYPFLRASRLQAVAVATTRTHPWHAITGGHQPGLAL
ncbi:aldehyde dehydrogenase family protein [Actinophytocola glycyrrhizae]|uniref:Aldehyde dehydrogenase family protein n=1 Tax=Actinophytocola glycyrrhizae TaxID=2044873 RepID=A0ABV9RTM8_9PSEU